MYGRQNSDIDPKTIDAIRTSRTRFLSHHYPERPRQIFERLAETSDPDLDGDRYGHGEIVAGFEEDIAQILGKPAAVFMPSGTMCQQIALRIWAERRGRLEIGMHRRNHLDAHEHAAYQHLHGLKGVQIGGEDRLLTVADLAEIAEPLAALLIELPQRELGGQLPSWDELVAVTDWAKQQGVPVHMDGARLWECQPFYQREYREIAALFDTVYVSFYKGLGGLGGAMLAGSQASVAEARIWRHRHGGAIFRFFPYVLAARHGFNERIGCMGAYHAKAVEIAAALSLQPTMAIVPNPPHTNMMRVYLKGTREGLMAAAMAVAQETGTWLFPDLRSERIPGYCVFELTVGDATLDLPTATIVELLALVQTKAEAKVR